MELGTYARGNSVKIVKPFELIIARDTTHAAQLMRPIQSNGFCKTRYVHEAIQVGSSVKEQETVEKMLIVEHADNPVEIVAHDRSQEIVGEANDPNAQIRLKALVLDNQILERRTVAVVVSPTILGSLGIATGRSEEGFEYAGPGPARAFDNPESEKVAQLACEAIAKLSHSP